MANQKLEKKVIVDAAFELLNEVGLEQFKLRPLAARLSVSATALYWHFADKDALITSMVEQFYFQANSRSQNETNWQSFLLRLGREFCKELNGCRDGARLCAIANPLRPSSIGTKGTGGPLIKYGFDRESSLSFESVVASFVLGWCIYKQNQPINEYLEKKFNFEDSFELGLNALINGLPTAVSS